MADSERIEYYYTGDTTSLRQATHEANKLLSSYGHVVDRSIHKINLMNRATKYLSATMKTLAGIKLAKWTSKGINQSIKYTETLNLFKVATAGATEEAEKFVDQVQEIYGLDPRNIMKHVGNFRQLADAAEMPANAATKMSLGLTKATNDIASLFNAPVERTFEDLMSGMQGMTRAVRKYGMDLRTTTLQQTALTLGIQSNVRNMSEASRQGLRYITMLRQARNAAGDFAETIESPANQLRIFKEQITQLGRAIGNLFIDPIATAIQYINGFVMALRMVITYIGAILGVNKSADNSNRDFVDSNNDVADSIGGIGSAAGGAATKLKKMLAPFDELNILSKQSSSGGAGGGVLDDIGQMDPEIIKAIEEMELKLESIRMKANQVRDNLLELFGFKFSDGKITSFDSDKFWGTLAMGPKAARKLANQAVEALNKAFNKIPAKKIGTVLGTLIDSAVGFASNIVENTDWQKLGNKISDSIVSTVSAVDFRSVGVLIATKYHILTEIISGVLNSLDSIDSVTGKSGWETLGIKFADMVAGALDSINWSKAGANLSRIAAGVYKLIITAIQKISWEDIGKDLAEFINNIDFTELLRNLVHIVIEIYKGLTTAYDNLWQNADPETRALLLGSGLLLMRKPLKIITKLVQGLTTSFDKKNDSLKTQNGLEESAAKFLMGSFAPGLNKASSETGMLVTNIGLAIGALGMLRSALDNTTATTGVTTEALSNLNTATANLNYTPAATYSNSLIAAFGGAANAANITSAAVTNMNNTALSLNPTPVSSYCSLLENAFNGATASVNTMNATVANLNSSPAAAYSSNVVKAFNNATSSVLSTGNAVAWTNDVTSSMNASPIETFCNKIVTAFGRAKSAISSATDKLKDFSTRQSNVKIQSPSKKSSSSSITSDNSSDSVITFGKHNKWANDRNKLSNKFGSFLPGAFPGLMPGLLPAMASGGVVTGPTQALIGEGKYDEAIIPLGNSPQMADLVKQIANATNAQGNSNSAPFQIFLDGDVLFNGIVDRAREVSVVTGSNPLFGG